MRWGKTYKERHDKRNSWINWYAWYPVHLMNGQWAWLEQVQCKRRNEYGALGSWEYI